MLGLGRASEYAGWWGGGAPSFRTTVTTSMASRPSIGTGTSLYGNDWTSPDFGNNISMAFDDASLGSNQSAIYSCTFKTGTVSEISWAEPSTGFLSPKTYDSEGSAWVPWLANFGNASGNEVSVKAQVGRRNSDNRVGILWEYGTYTQIYFSSATWDTTLANKFISLVVCQAPTSSSFANWTGGTVGASQDALRAMLVNASTGALIDQVDSAITIFNPVVANPSAITWRPYWQSPLVAGDFNTQTFTMDNFTGDNRDYLFLNSGWVSIGDILDPAATDSTSGLPYYRLLSGQGMPGTVGGSRAWVNFYSAGTYVSGSNNGVYRLSTGRTTQSTNTYSLMPDSFNEPPFTTSAHP